MLHELGTDLFYNLCESFFKHLIKFRLHTGIELETSKGLMHQTFSPPDRQV